MSKLTKLAVLLLAGVMLFTFIGCGSKKDDNISQPFKSNHSSEYAQSPEEALEWFFTGSYSNDVDMKKLQFRALGIGWDDMFAGATSSNSGSDSAYSLENLEITIDDVRLERFMGAEFEEAVNDITEYWLADEDYAEVYDFVYNAFDIEEAGYAYFTVSYNDPESGERRSEDNEFCVVKTDMGWFVAIDGV